MCIDVFRKPVAREQVRIEFVGDNVDVVASTNEVLCIGDNDSFGTAERIERE